MGALVGIVNYGCGNLFSVENAIKKITSDYLVSSDKDELSKCDKLILPGVGSYKVAMDNIIELGLLDFLKEQCNSGKSILGICLGMQLLLDKSYEGGETYGLGIVGGEVVEFTSTKEFRVPHIGWNDITYSNPSPDILKGIDIGTSFYFVHSFYCELGESIPSCYVDYCNRRVTVGFQKENIHAVQFHPEKSQDSGLKIISNFLNGIN
jgi:glutamine amidotransferase